MKRTFCMFKSVQSPYPTLPYPTLPFPTLPHPSLPHPTLPLYVRLSVCLNHETFQHRNWAMYNTFESLLFLLLFKKMFCYLKADEVVNSLEGSLYKLQSALAQVDRKDKPNNRLSQYIESAKDKQVKIRSSISGIIVISIVFQKVAYVISYCLRDWCSI